MSSSIKLITFDVTGTILLFKTPVLKKYASTAFENGLNADYATLEKNFLKGWSSLREKHPNFGKKTGLGWEKWWMKMVEKTFDGFINENDNKIVKIANDLIKYHSTADAFEIRDGTKDLLNYLKNKKKKKLGIVSNYDPRLHIILKQLKLNNYFDFVLTSYEFGCEKPNEKIFREAVKLGECHNGVEALHVGDDYVNDYLGAKNAGLNAILINQNEKINDNVNRSDVFDNFHRLKKHLEKF